MLFFSWAKTENVASILNQYLKYYDMFVERAKDDCKQFDLQ